MSNETTAKNNERKKYVLQVQRGEELNLQRMDEICNEESIMRPSYEKAMRALMQIMRRTRRFHEICEGTWDADDDRLENLLFSYSGNVIAFAAQRGGGKTATMLSFSKILNEGFGKNSAYYTVDNSFLNTEENEEGKKKEEKPEIWLTRCSFMPMTPVAPAVLEGDQNILYVVLSRLYRYAERLIATRSRNDRIKEAQKNKIIRSFQRVLSGINGIKHPDKKHPGDLASMQDICDGLSLSRHFFDLVQNILELAAGELSPSDRYLVIQLDDADSKMQKVYEVMEDVRKYLMIPNLVILMSVDPKCMSDVVLQDNLRCFPDLLKIDKDRVSRDLSKNANKYIDKLIPPTHVVHLPMLDQIMIHWGDMLRLRYVDEDEHDVYEWMADESLDLQTSILLLIYRKTGILFTKPEHYLHNIIPRTLRGLAQFLALLDSMKDIPEPNCKESVKKYAEGVLTQSEIAAANQRKLADYFKTSWLNVKITDQEDLDFLQRFADTVSANRVRLAVKYLWKCYGEDFAGNKPQYFADRNLEIKDIREREDLDQLMWEIDRVRRTDKDFRLLFAIRTMLTLDTHQHILKRKREAAREYVKDSKDKKVLVFDLRPEHIWAPERLAIEDAAKELGIQEKNRESCARLFAPMLGDERFVTAARIIGNKATSIPKFQKLIQKVQELAVLIHANCDVAYAVRTSLKKYALPCPTDARADVSQEHMGLFMSVLNQVNCFNDGKLDNWLTELQSYGAASDDLLAALFPSQKAALNEEEVAAPAAGDDASVKGPETQEMGENDESQDMRNL